jgi:hypothetical protein
MVKMVMRKDREENCHEVAGETSHLKSLTVRAPHANWIHAHRHLVGGSL